MGVLRFPVGALLGLGLVAVVGLAGCGSSPGGGAPPAQGSSSQSGASSGAPASSGGGAAMPAGMATSTSLTGWTTGGSPAIDPAVGNPKGPSLMLPGDKSYVWQDLKKAINSFSFDMNTQGLADFFFGANASGQGYLFRIDTRGGTNYTGFAQTADWMDWDCPGNTGTTDVPANTWIHVDLQISASDATATATWSGGKKETFKINGSLDSCNTANGDTTMGAYKPVGTAFGFQGDGLGASSQTWIANFK